MYFYLTIISPAIDSLCCLTGVCSFLFPQANEVLQSFLQSQAATQESILQADRALTVTEKNIAGTGQGLAHRREERFLQGLLTAVRTKPSSNKECPLFLAKNSAKLETTKGFLVAHSAN